MRLAMIPNMAEGNVHRCFSFRETESFLGTSRKFKNGHWSVASMVTPHLDPRFMPQSRCC